MDCRDKKAGQYTAPSLAKEGFIHCSTLTQVLPVAEKFYKGQSGLILLGIDPARLSSALKWEPPFEGTPPTGVSSGECSRISMALSIWMPSFRSLIWPRPRWRVLCCPPAYDFDSSARRLIRLRPPFLFASAWAALRYFADDKSRLSPESFSPPCPSRGRTPQLSTRLYPRSRSAPVGLVDFLPGLRAVLLDLGMGASLLPNLGFSA